MPFPLESDEARTKACRFESVAGLPVVIEIPEKRFSTSETRAIAAGNWHRVLREMWA